MNHMGFSFCLARQSFVKDLTGMCCMLGTEVVQALDQAGEIGARNRNAQFAGFGVFGELINS